MTTKTEGMIGKVVDGRFLILEKLSSQGGMGLLYKARDLESDVNNVGEEFVTIKFMPKYPNQQDQIEAERQFDREAHFLMHAKHVRIPTGIHHGKKSKPKYLVMEFIDGQNLDQKYNRNGRYIVENPDEILDVCKCILETLVYVHKRKVYHRDIKSANIMFKWVEETLEEQIMLVDFGLVTRTGTYLRTAGTPGHIAPEQKDDSIGPIDARTDLYCLGVTIVRLLRNTLPPVDDTPLVIDGVHPQVCQVLKKAIRKRPEERWDDAQAMLDALRVARAVAAGEPMPPQKLPVPLPFDDRLISPDAETETQELSHNKSTLTTAPELLPPTEAVPNGHYQTEHVVTTQPQVIANEHSSVQVVQPSPVVPPPVISPPSSPSVLHRSWIGGSILGAVLLVAPILLGAPLPPLTLLVVMLLANLIGVGAAVGVSRQIVVPAGWVQLLVALAAVCWLAFFRDVNFSVTFGLTIAGAVCTAAAAVCCLMSEEARARQETV